MTFEEFCKLQQKAKLASMRANALNYRAEMAYPFASNKKTQQDRARLYLKLAISCRKMIR